MESWQKTVDFGVISALNERAEAGKLLKSKTSDMCVCCRYVFSFSKVLVTKSSRLTHSGNLLTGAVAKAKVNLLTVVANSN